MAEALAAVGIAASVVQLAVLGCETIARIDEFQSKTKDVPAVFREISIQLPLLVEICQGVVKENLNTDSDNLAGVINGCIQLVEALDSLIAKVLPIQGDSRIIRTWKAVGSVRLEKKVLDYQKTLETYKTMLMLHFSRTTDVSVRRLSEAKVPPAPRNTCYYFPSPQIAQFIGREEILLELDEALRSVRSDMHRPNVAVLTGMGGQGKTSIAMEYCRRSQSKRHFNSILWIDATSTVTIAQSHANIADQIAKRKRAFDDSNACVLYVKETLEKWACPWLAVFDNFDQPRGIKNITDYYPRSSDGAIIFTSRNSECRRLGKTLQISGMAEYEGVELLLHRAQVSTTYENVESARPIVQKLGCLPLAIDQAGAYISARRISLSVFNEHYESRKEKVLRHTPDLWDYRRKLTDHDDDETSLSVFTTWEMSFQNIVSECRDRTSVIHFLTLLAFFSNLDIRDDMFKSYYEVNKTPPAWLNTFTSERSWDRFEYEDVVVQLSQLSLVQHTESNESECRVSLHPLIRDWIQLRLKLKERQQYTMEAIAILRSHIACIKDQNGKWQLRTTREILSHLDACSHNQAKFLANDEAYQSDDLRDCLIAFAAFYTRHGRYAEAEDLVIQTLTGDEKVLGAQHGIVLRTKLQMTDIFLCQGRYQEAEALLLTLLPFFKDSQDPSSILLMTNLAQAYFKEGRYSEAARLYTQALEEQKKSLPLGHPNLLKNYESLAQVYRNQGQYSHAVEIYIMVLAGYEKLHQSTHPDSLQAMVDLASSYRNQACFHDSVVLYEKALVAHETYLGPDHPNTLVNMLNLAINYRNLSRFEEAEKVFHTIWSRSERILGSEHPDTLKIVMNLAMNFDLSGHADEAESHYRIALAGREKKLGVENPYTMRTVERLVSLLWAKRRLDEAESLANRILRAQKSDPWLPETTDLSGWHPAAVELFLRALARDEEIIATNHNDHVATLKSLMNVYDDQKQVDKAQKIRSQLSEIGLMRSITSTTDKITKGFE